MLSVFSMRCSTMFITLVVGVLMGATGEPVAPSPVLEQPAPVKKTAWQFIPTSQYANLTWDERAMQVFEYGVTANDGERFTASLFLRTSDGHGRSSSNTYGADGWRICGEARLQPQQGKQPQLSVYAEYLYEDATLSVQSATSSATMWAKTHSTGVELRADLAQKQFTWKGRTGLYRTVVDDSSDADIVLLGGGVDVPLGEAFTGSAALTGYQERYQDDFTGLELAGAVTYRQSAHASLTLGGHYFPNGIPMGGTMFSSVSSIGMVYGQSAAARMRFSHMGYVTLGGEWFF